MTYVSLDVRDANGVPAPWLREVDNKLGVSATDSLADIAEGKVAGRSTINKFGRNIEIDSGVTTDIWCITWK